GGSRRATRSGSRRAAQGGRLASAWPRSLPATTVTGNLSCTNDPAGLNHKLRACASRANWSRAGTSRAMIAGLPHPVATRRTRACPAIVNPGAAVGPGRRPAPHPPGPPPAGLPPPRIPDRVIFDKLIQVLVFGCGYRRIADATCSATPLRRRRDEWVALGLADRLQCAVLGAYDRLFGLELAH